MANEKVQWSGKINIEKKKLVEEKRKLIDSLTGCNRVHPYMVSQEVVLLAYGNVRISSRVKFPCEDFQKLQTWQVITCSLLALFSKLSTR